MTVEESIAWLDANAARFATCIASLPEDLFLAPMDAWAPRDVLAHLIGWNRYTVEGGKLLVEGKMPPFFQDAGDDFAAVNAVLVQTYPLRDRRALLAELETSLQELRRYLRSLSAEEWEAGVMHGQHAITLQNSVQALVVDYAGHTEQIERWAEGQR
jgi:hypothetical protein